MHFLRQGISFDDGFFKYNLYVWHGLSPHKILAFYYYKRGMVFRCAKSFTVVWSFATNKELLMTTRDGMDIRCPDRIAI